MPIDPMVTILAESIGQLIAAVARLLGRPESEIRAEVRMYLAGPAKDETDAVSAEIEASEPLEPKEP